MREIGSPKVLFENLDLLPIYPILWTGLHQYGPGKPVTYQPEWDLRALMLRQLEKIPNIKDLVKRLSGNQPARKREELLFLPIFLIDNLCFLLINLLCRQNIEFK